MGRKSLRKSGPMTLAQRQRRFRQKVKRERINPKLVAKLERRAEREQQLASKIVALPQQRFGVIYADPEWETKTWSIKGGNRLALNHYPTSPLAEIMARDVPSIAADDCVLLLWTPVPHLEQAMRVLHAWGFEYKSMLTWDKVLIGTGRWLRNQTEHLLIGTRGKTLAPAPGTQLSSLLREQRREHSRKPDTIADWIDKAYPTLPKIELNRRGPARPGWSAWGNEAGGNE